MWSEFAADSLVPHRAHLACAMLMYMAATPAQRDAVQRAYARFQRSGQRPDATSSLRDAAAESAAASLLNGDEVALLEAFRLAEPAARDEAVMNLREGAALRVSRNAGSA